MILLPLLLIAALPQTATAMMAVRAQVTETCVITTAHVACRGARDRSGRRRIARDGSVAVVEF